MKAKDFRLPDQDEKIHTLSGYKGKWVVVYFYPKDDTPGCAKEACNFRDKIATLQEKGVIIVGISKDSPKSHKKFAEKYHLNFTLLSDESKDVMRSYGAWGMKKFMGREYEGTFRNTYLINPRGEIEKVYEKVNPLRHVKEILSDLESLQSETLSPPLRIPKGPLVHDLPKSRDAVNRTRTIAPPARRTTTILHPDI